MHRSTVQWESLITTVFGEKETGVGIELKESSNNNTLAFNKKGSFDCLLFGGEAAKSLISKKNHM